MRATAASPAPSRACHCHPAQWCTCPRRSTRLPPRASSARARATCSSRGRIHLYGAELIRVVRRTSSWQPIRKVLPPTAASELVFIAPHFIPRAKATPRFRTASSSPAYPRFGCSFFDVDSESAVQFRKGTHIVQPGTTLQHAVVGPPDPPLLTCRRQSHASGKSLCAVCAAATRLAC